MGRTLGLEAYALTMPVQRLKLTLGNWKVLKSGRRALNAGLKILCVSKV
jgi:hypothetical protein